MSSEAGEDAGEKEHEPTERRLEEARREGDVARSTDLATAAAYGGLLLALLGAGAAIAGRAGTALAVLLAQADRLAPLFADGGRPLTGGLLGAVGLAIAPLLLAPFGAVLAAFALQRAIVAAPRNLLPQLSRISPLAAARQKFGRRGLFEFAKSAVKLGVTALVLWFFLLARLPEILGMAALGPGPAAGGMMRLVVEFLALALGVAAVIGALDFLWQRHEHRRRLRMSRKELMDELRQAEGDPHLRQERRRRGQEIATNRMILDVAKADVVVVNPTHYAVALRWKRGDRHAPICVAKGVDEVAARIRAAAAEAGVPLHRDPPTARALHATVGIGEEIRPEHYRAVAAAIRFAEAMRRKAGRRGARA